MSLILTQEANPYRSWNVEKPNIPTTVLRRVGGRGVLSLNLGVGGHLRRFQPDLMVVCGYAQPAFVAAFLARSLPSTKRVLWTEAPGVPNLDYPPQPIKSDLLRSTIRSAIMRVCLPRTDEVWAIGPDAVKFFDRRSAPVRHIPYFAVNRENPGSIPSGKVHYVYLGQLSERKGASRLPRVVKLLNDLWGAEYRLSVAGEGPLGERLRAEFDSCNEVKMLGQVTADEAADLLNTADVLIAPATYDGWGLHIVEALNSGTYVVATESTNAARFILDSRDLGLITGTSLESFLSGLASHPRPEHLRSTRSARTRSAAPFLIDAGTIQVQESLSALATHQAHEPSTD